MPRFWTPSFTARSIDRRLRVIALTLYYLAILVGLIVLYGRGDFSTPSFIYQGF
jgi:hypothetical protein